MVPFFVFAYLYKRWFGNLIIVTSILVDTAFGLYVVDKY